MRDHSGSTQLPSEQHSLRAICFHPKGSFIEFEEKEIEQPISRRFEEVVRRYPERIAVKTATEVLTYAELNTFGNRVADALLRQGPDSSPVGLLFPNGAHFVVASLGALKAARVQVPLESTFPIARLRYVVEQSRASIIVTDSANLPLARKLGDLRVVNIDAPGRIGAAQNPGLAIRPDAIAAIAYTSGSTGQPKGIIWNHRGLLHAVMRHTNTTRLCSHDRLVMFRASVRAWLYALLNGATYYPVDLTHEDSAGVSDWLMTEEITVYRAAVSAFRSFAGALAGTERFPFLRLIVLFGEPVYRTEIALYRKYFPDSCLLAGTLGCMEFDDYAYFFLGKNTPLPDGVVPGGYPIDGTDTMVLDENGHPVGFDQVGQIAIRSRYNTAGYWRRPDLTQAAFPEMKGPNDEPIYLTGDMGRVRSDGCLFHLGRKDFQVKIRGHRVEVSEVETALLEIAGVKEAVVVGWEDTPGNKRLVAYVVPSGPQIPPANQLRRILADRLPIYMVPFTFIAIEALPLTATGKVDRRALPPPNGTRPALDTPFAEPRSTVEEQLVGIWADALGLDRVGINDNFLDLGGDSLAATRLVVRVQSQLHVRLPLRLLFEASTVAEMAELLIGASISESDQKGQDRSALLRERV